MLGATVLPYVQGVPGPQLADLWQLLQESTRQRIDLSCAGVTALQGVKRPSAGAGMRSLRAAVRRERCCVP